jgi:dipeptide/tripeptide permease
MIPCLFDGVIGITCSYLPFLIMKQSNIIRILEGLFLHELMWEVLQWESFLSLNEHWILISSVIFEKISTKFKRDFVKVARNIPIVSGMVMV